MTSTFSNPLGLNTPLSRLERDERTGDLVIRPAAGRRELNAALSQIAQLLNSGQLAQGNLAASVLQLIGVQPVTAFPTLNGFPTQSGGNTYAPIAWGPLPAFYARPTLTSEAWTVGAEVPSSESRHLQYVQAAGTTPGSGVVELKPTVAFRIPPNFRRWRGNAIVWRYTIQEVDGFTTGDEIEASILVEATVPGWGPFERKVTTSLTAPGPHSEAGAYTSLSITDTELGEAWQEGALVRVTPGFKFTGASSGVDLTLRWGDLSINVE